MITFEDAYRGWLAVRYPDRSFSPAVQLLIAALNDAVARCDSLIVDRLVERLGQISGYLDTWGERGNAAVDAARAVYEAGRSLTDGFRICQLPRAEALLRLAAVQCMGNRPCYAMVQFLLGVVLYDQELYQEASLAWSISRQTLSLLAKSHSQYTPRSGWYLEMMDAVPRLVARNQIVFDNVALERGEEYDWPFNFEPGGDPVSPFYEKPHTSLPD